MLKFTSKFFFIKKRKENAQKKIIERLNNMNSLKLNLDKPEYKISLEKKIVGKLCRDLLLCLKSFIKENQQVSTNLTIL